jgi:hypothetical protein
MLKHQPRPRSGGGGGACPKRTKTTGIDTPAAILRSDWMSGKTTWKPTTTQTLDLTTMPA